MLPRFACRPVSVRGTFATTTPSLHIYIADTDFASPLSDVIEEVGLREVDEGGRVTFWAADARIFACSRQVEGVPVVSAPRLFADLSSFSGRGGDAADHVKAELIDPLHHGGSTEGNSGVALGSLAYAPGKALPLRR